jgi:acyl-CoA synthetase (AMP-forming)/AMP-acid ligase II
MTEAASQICANPLDPAERRAGSVGRPVAIGLRIVEAGSVDPDRNPLPHGHVGEVEIRGPSVISTSFDGTGGPDGWLPTSDLGRIDADGFLYLVGRADDVINRGGEKVYPADVERVLLADPRVTAAAVVARPHPVTGQEPIAVVIAEAGPADRDDLAADLLRRCEASLSRFMVPAQITVADTLPAGPTGKVRRAELRAAVLHMQRSSS